MVFDRFISTSLYGLAVYRIFDMVSVVVVAVVAVTILLDDSH